MQQINFFVEQAFASGNYDECLIALKKVKNLVIGSQKQKVRAVEMDIIPRLIQFMIEDQQNQALMLESAIILNSLSKAGSDTIAKLIDSGAFQVLLKGLSHPNQAYMEACLRCIRSILTSPNAPTDVIYQDTSVVPHLINIMHCSKCTKENVASIFAACCKTNIHQEILLSHNIISALWPLINSRVPAYQLPAIKCLTAVIRNNRQVAREYCKLDADAAGNASGTAGDAHTARPRCQPIVELLMSRHLPSSHQLTAATCLTALATAGGLPLNHDIIVLKTLGTLVTFCSKDEDVDTKIRAAGVLAQLIERDAALQHAASICNHLITNMAAFLKLAANLTAVHIVTDDKLMDVDDDNALCIKLKQSALKVFACLAANDEEIRKKVMESERVMEEVLYGLSDPCRPVQLAALHTLLSVSRSVQQLRTALQDHLIYKPIIRMIKNCSDSDIEMLKYLSAVICNLLMDFSPCKETLVEDGIIETVCKFIRHEDTTLKLHGVWGLMNLTFEGSHKICEDVLTNLTPQYIFSTLLSPPSVNHSESSDSDNVALEIVIKTLGMLRNMLATKHQVVEDFVMKYGEDMLAVLVMLLETDGNREITHQVLCLLANVASWEAKKSLLMANEDLIKKILDYMSGGGAAAHSTQTQVSAVSCVHNLVCQEEEGAADRQQLLKNLGAQKILQQLLNTPDQPLFDRAKSTLQLFNM